METSRGLSLEILLKFSSIISDRLVKKPSLTLLSSPSIRERIFMLVISSSARAITHSLEAARCSQHPYYKADCSPHTAKTHYGYGKLF